MLKAEYIMSLPMNLHNQKLCLLKQHSESFEIWLAIIRINTESKSLIMKLSRLTLKTYLQKHTDTHATN